MNTRKEEDNMHDLVNDIAAAQVLGMGAMRYAGKAITAAHGGDPPIGSGALVALEHTRQIITADDAMPALVAGALRDLQMAAVVFTVQLATSDGHGDPAILQQLEDKLVAMLELRGVVRVVHVHDDVVVAQSLGSRAFDYARQIIVAEDSDVPIGSEAVERSVMDLQVAAVAFTVQLAISEGHDPKELRRIETALVERLTWQGGS